jgi:hypothetical protein
VDTGGWRKEKIAFTTNKSVGTVCIRWEGGFQIDDLVLEPADQ